MGICIINVMLAYDDNGSHWCAFLQWHYVYWPSSPDAAEVAGNGRKLATDAKRVTTLGNSGVEISNLVDL